MNPCSPHLILPFRHFLGGGLVAQSIIKSKKQVGLYLIPLAVCLAFCYLTKVDAAYYMLITVALGALVFYLFDYRTQDKKKE